MYGAPYPLVDAAQELASDRMSSEIVGDDLPELVRTEVLRHGDVITVGRVRLIFADRSAEVIEAQVRLAGDDDQQNVTFIGGPQDDWSLPAQRLHLICSLSNRRVHSTS